MQVCIACLYYLKQMQLLIFTILSFNLIPIACTWFDVRIFGSLCQWRHELLFSVTYQLLIRFAWLSWYRLEVMRNCVQIQFYFKIELTHILAIMWIYFYTKYPLVCRSFAVSSCLKFAFIVVLLLYYTNSLLMYLAVSL